MTNWAHNSYPQQQKRLFSSLLSHERWMHFCLDWWLLIKLPSAVFKTQELTGPFTINAQRLTYVTSIVRVSNQKWEEAYILLPDNVTKFTSQSKDGGFLSWDYEHLLVFNESVRLGRLTLQVSHPGSGASDAHKFELTTQHFYSLSNPTLVSLRVFFFFIWFHSEYNLLQINYTLLICCVAVTSTGVWIPDD